VPDPGGLLNNMNVQVWWRAIRYQFSTPATLSAFVGTAIAWSATGRIDASVLANVLLALIANQAALHLSDDYFDYRHGVDSDDSSRRNLYAGGSKVLPLGLLKPAQVLVAFSLLYAVTFGIGVYLTILKGPIVFLIGIFGGLCAIFYAAPPFKLAYRGLGEAAIGINFGPVIGLGSYLVQILPPRASLGEPTAPALAALSPEVVLLSLPLGLITFGMIVVQEIADVEEDRAAGKRTLVVRFGTRAAVVLHFAALVASIAIVLLAIIVYRATPWLLLTLLAAPTAARSVQIFTECHRDPERAEAAVADFLAYRFHSLMGILIVVAYGIEGLARGRPLDGLGAIVGLFAVTYLPIVAMLYRGAPNGVTAAAKVLHLVGWRLVPSSSLGTSQIAASARVSNTVSNVPGTPIMRSSDGR